MADSSRFVLYFGLIACALSGGGSHAGDRDRGTAAAAAREDLRPPHPRITVSKKTTVITSPIRKDGYPDYRAALNQMACSDTSPENNAAVPFWQVFGPAEISGDSRTDFFRALQMSSPPSNGAYFVSFDEHVCAIRDTEEVLSQMHVPDEDDSAEGYFEPEECARLQLEDAQKRPWSRPEYPAVASWLEANEKPLALLVAASRRPRMYCPLESRPVLFCQLPHVRLVRSAAEALSVRATQSLGAGKVDDAWQDLLAIHRLARLIAQGPTLIESLVALAVQHTACDGALVLLSSTDLTAEQARRFQADLRDLPRMPSLAEKLDIGERYALLDTICAFARDPATAIEDDFLTLPGDSRTAGGALTRGLAKALIRTADGFLVDWDDVLREGNRWYDRAVDAMGKPTYRERLEEAERIEGEIRETTPFWIRALVSDPTASVASPSSRVTFGRLVGELGVAFLSPRLRGTVQLEEREMAHFTMTQVAIALAGYRAEHGAYPRDLAALRPKHLQEIPKDPFTGNGFRYQLRQIGYLLYSVGPNCEDDGGRNWREEYDQNPRDTREDRSIRLEADDVVLRVPRQCP